ncbi:MAG: PQQ-binding-like beta-propeller repeat protein [Nitrospirae bacterium]|nr:PQQ-binding-like beta-propeller repeat protein [Nitrospirota bacterium]
MRLKFDLQSPKLSACFEKNTTIEPEDIMARADDVLVSDQTAMKIFRFSKKGEFLGTFGQEVTSGPELKRAFYKWTKNISIICMILLLASLLHINRREKKRELAKIVITPTDKPLHFLQRKISLPDGRYILLCLLVIINVLLWINVSSFESGRSIVIISLLLGLGLPIALLVLLFIALATILRAVKKPSGEKYSKRSSAPVIGIIILLSVAIMSGRIINALPDGIARPLYHVMLSLSMGDYKLYEKLSRIGDVSSVPYLIQALKSEQSNESLRGDMSHHPLLDALSRITGNNPGYKYEDWENWWTANKDKTEQQWRLSAIEKEGYPAANYPGATAIASIIEAIGFKDRVPYGKEYLLNSAGVLLSKCASAEVLSVIENRLQGNISARFKRGASRALGLLGLKECIPFLRILVISDDLSVRSIALSELNKLQTKLLSFAPAINLAHIIDTEENIKYMSAGADKGDNDTLFYAISSAVKRLDLKTGKILWSHNTLGELGSELVIAKGKVLFYCFDGMVYCLDSATGHFLWKHQTASPRQGYHSKITVLGDYAIMGAEDNLWAFDIASGRVKWIIRNQPSSEELITHSADHLFLATGRGEFLKISPEGKVIDTMKAGPFIQALAADNNFAYVITQGKPMHLKIYSAEKMTLLHDEKIGWKDLPLMTLNAETIIVSGQAGIRAFDRKSAQLLWSEEIERYHAYPKIEPSDKYLAYGDEIRNPRTGEIICKYRVTGNSQSRVIGNNFVMNTSDKKIYIFRLPPESGI